MTPDVYPDGVAPWPYNLPEYQRARLEVLAGQPRCHVGDCRRIATTVDHFPVTVLQVRLGRAPVELLWDPRNLRPACRSCNSRLGAYVGNRRRRGRGAEVTRSRRW